MKIVPLLTKLIWKWLQPKLKTTVVETDVVGEVGTDAAVAVEEEVETGGAAAAIVLVAAVAEAEVCFDDLICKWSIYLSPLFHV